MTLRVPLMPLFVIVTLFCGCSGDTTPAKSDATAEPTASAAESSRKGVAKGKKEKQVGGTSNLGSLEVSPH
jgi:hypothetical protein